MSFGFSVGDLIGAANLTYRLIKALQGSHDAGDDYRAAIHELGCMQQAFIRVSCLGANQDVSQATFDSASFIVMGSMEVIESFLAKTRKYDRRLGGLGTSGIAQNLRKVGWTLYKAEDMKKLRETLHRRLSSVNVLLAAANLDSNGAGNVARYLESDEQPVSERLSAANISNDSSKPETADTSAAPIITEPVSVEVSQPMVPVIDNQEEMFTADTRTPTVPTEAQLDSDRVTASMSTKPFSLSVFSHTELTLLITDTVQRSIRINEIAELLRTLISIGEFQLPVKECKELTSLLDRICGERIPIYNPVKAPVRFKDAVGRKFSFPWALCKTWKGMEELIKQAFLHVDVVGQHVNEGHYDLVGPDGEIIVSHVWEAMIQPGWTVTMHMWPMPEPPQPPPESPKQPKEVCPEPPPQPCSPLSQSMRELSAEAGSDHGTPPEGLQTPLSPSLTETSATNTEFKLSPESLQSTHPGSQTSRTSTSGEDVAK